VTGQTWTDPRAVVLDARQEGSCMFDGHIDPYGHSDHRRVVVFYLGSFRARVCLEHANELRVQLGECIRGGRQ
jgi:hypothetical protein